jgi:hypothetical protein
MTLHGIVHGNIIRLDQPVGLADGAQVEVEVRALVSTDAAAACHAGLRPPPGLGKGFITVVAEDESHLGDFSEYMP